MKFVHIADIHFDSPFVNLSDKENLGDLRRLEQRKVFNKVIQYIKQNNIKYLFISGDLYEQKYVKRTTIEYINNLFKEIPETKIFIAPGNHDPYIKNSYYNKFKWNENVKIFSSKIEKVQTEDANIYGFGFDDFYCKDSGIDNLKIDDIDKLNILVMHGSIEGGNIEDNEYNPLNLKRLQQLFDYSALGHIHKLNYNQENNQRVVYPGSTISLGFDELGQHGMIVGEITKESIDLEFVPLDETEFKVSKMDVTNIVYKEELIEKLDNLVVDEKNFLEIIFVGERNFEIKIYELYKLISNDKIIKLKDNTKIKYNLCEIANETTLRGIFVKEMLDKLNNQELTPDDKNIVEKAIEIGLETLE